MNMSRRDSSGFAILCLGLGAGFILGYIVGLCFACP